MSLIYLLSSLPMLKFGADPGITPTGFADVCREQLGAADARAAESLLNGEVSDHPFARAWQDRETILRNAVARHRARLSGADAARWLRHAQGCDSRIENLVEDAFQESDPLQREDELDRIRWTVADEMQGPDPLCKNAVFAYAVKLRVLTRRAERDTKTGTGHFEQLAEIRPADGADAKPQNES
ncbi:MAG: DUF2764 family protein [Kiritimatiellae bacterium]|nr:DUF2764 family protein [Kiritimatiellia bacterium]